MTNSPMELLTSKRGDYVDESFFGSIYLANKNGIYFSLGLSPDNICFMRSLAKPLQASIMAECSIIKDYNLKSYEIAICQGSHAGSEKHVLLLKNLIKKTNVKLSDLKLHACAPLDTRNFNGKKTKLYNNCSAKHVMMVMMSKYLGYSPYNYTNPNHPIQKLIWQKQCELSEYNSDIITFDGCGTPLWGLPYKNVIKAYFNFFHDKKYSKNIASVIKNPYIYGGYNRFDTEIITKSHKKLFAKVGAGGLVLVYNFEKDEILLVKLTQNNNEARKLITLDVLKKINWLYDIPIKETVYNQQNKPVAKYCYDFKLR